MSRRYLRGVVFHEMLLRHDDLPLLSYTYTTLTNMTYSTCTFVRIMHNLVLRWMNDRLGLTGSGSRVFPDSDGASWRSVRV